MVVLHPEHNREVRHRKLFVLLTVSTIFLLVHIMSEQIPYVDHVAHLAVLSYLGARVFVRDL